MEREESNWDTTTTSTGLLETICTLDEMGLCVKGHSAIKFGYTIVVFGGYGDPSGEEQGKGMLNDVWRFDLQLGALLADNKVGMLVWSIIFR